MGMVLVFSIWQPRDELGRFSPASKTSGPSSTRRASTTAGPSSTRRASTTAGRSSTRRASTTAGPSTNRRASTTAGPSTNRRASTTAGPSTNRRASTQRNFSTKGPSSTRRTSTKTPEAMDTMKGAGASSSRAHEMEAGCNLDDGHMDVTQNGAETEVHIRFDKLELTIMYTDESDNEAPLLSGKNIRAQVKELRRVIKRKLKYKMARGEMIN
ncbi:hypothetical protein EJB05_51559, partial [Eragrostis curvula]